MSPDKVEILRIATRQLGLQEFCRESPLVQNGPVFGRLSSQQQLLLLKDGQVAAFPPGRVILEVGQHATRPALVLIGSVSLQTDFGLGLGLLGPGEMFGLDALWAESPPLGATAREEVRLAWLEPEAVRQTLARAPDLAAYLRQVTQSWAEQLRESADFFSRW